MTHFNFFLLFRLPPGIEVGRVSMVLQSFFRSSMAGTTLEKNNDDVSAPSVGGVGGQVLPQSIRIRADTRHGSLSEEDVVEGVEISSIPGEEQRPLDLSHLSLEIFSCLPTGATHLSTQ